MQIDFDDRTTFLSHDQVNLLTELLVFAAKEETIPGDAELSISIVTNKEIKELNNMYRHKNQITDVLSFALQDDIENEVDIKDANIPLILGDIIISLDKAKEQAKEYNHSLNRELGFLSVHGLLHLLGYDHMNQVEEREMFGKQNELLTKFGLER